jgi:ribonucleotide reductase alpha subunit
MENNMYVTKRNGTKEVVSFDKVLNRIRKLSNLEGFKKLNVNGYLLAQQINNRIYDGVRTSELDELTAELCASKIQDHPDYGILASRVVISNHHKNTSPSFSEVVYVLYHNHDIHDAHNPLVSTELYHIVMENKNKLNDYIDYTRDYAFDYFGFKTLERAYLMRINRKVIERPQQMLMRVALGIHGRDFKDALNTYNEMSQKYFIHATPTLFNAGTPRQQLSSCFLVAMKDDSIRGIYGSLLECALISKWAGGIGVHIHNIRGKNSEIRGTNGVSNGVVPMLRVYNNTARYVDQCLTPDTWIFTQDGAKKIKDLVSGLDKVYNINGNVEQIENVLEHDYNGDLLQINSEYSHTSLEITPEHPILVLDDISGNNTYLEKTDEEVRDSLEKGFSRMVWKEAGKLEVGDRLVYKIPNQDSHSDSESKNVVDIPEITEEDCHMYGLIFNNHPYSGYTHHASEQKRNTIRFYNGNIGHDFDNAKQYFERKCIAYEVTEKDKYTELSWTVSLSFPFKYSDFYNSSGYNNISPRLMKLPINKIQALIRGFKLENETIRFSPNIKVIHDFKLLYLKIGKMLVINNKYNASVIDADKNGYVFDKIQKITKTIFDGILYDLQMPSTHNYMTSNGGLVHNGGGKRKGSFAIYLEPHHPDIYEFLDLRKNHGNEEARARDLFYALWISDLFMKRVENDEDWSLMCPDKCPGLSDCYGEEFEELYLQYETEKEKRDIKTVKARDLWFKILESQVETGTPYMLYKDSANRKSNQQNLGTIKSSNLCVAPETDILTDKGFVQIKDLEGKRTKVWNGKEFSESKILKTGKNIKLITVKFNDGSTLACTEHHKFYVQFGYLNKTKDDILKHTNVKKMDAKDLKKGMNLVKCDYPIIDNDKNMRDAYNRGYECYMDEAEVPIEYSMKSKIEWLSGYCDNKDRVKHVNSNIYVYSSNLKILLNVKKLLQTCGISCNISPDDTPNPKISLTGHTLSKLTKIGFTLKDRNLTDIKTVKESSQYIKVVSIENEGRRDDTYCFNEKKRHAGIFNGIFAGNCTEIMEYSDKDETAVCNLASIGLSKYLKYPELTKTMVPPQNPHDNNDDNEKRSVSHSVMSEDDQKMMVTIYTKTNCSWCKLSKGVLRERKIKFREINLDDDVKRMAFYAEQTAKLGRNVKSVPQIYLDDEHIGGYTALWDRLKPTINYDKLVEISRVITKNLNKVIDRNFYPTMNTFRSNKRHRPIGIGVQGLADLFALMRVPYDSEEAQDINKKIFEAIYYGALVESNVISIKRSCDITHIFDIIRKHLSSTSDSFNEIDDFANYIDFCRYDENDPYIKAHLTTDTSQLNILREEGFTDDEIKDLVFLIDKINPTVEEWRYFVETINTDNELLLGTYQTFIGSPMFEGQLQFDLWDVEQTDNFDWDTLRANIGQYGIRNSLLLAPMPTASTSQILGNNECFEAFTSNMYVRRTLAGEFMVINKHLLNDLINMGIWNNDIKDMLMLNTGSVQGIEAIPKYLQKIYKITWEIKQRAVVDLAVGRGPYICQSQSMNIHSQKTDFRTLTSLHFYTWEKGLKTGMYYLRTKPKAMAQQFTIDPSKRAELENKTTNGEEKEGEILPIATITDEDKVDAIHANQQEGQYTQHEYIGFQQQAQQQAQQQTGRVGDDDEEGCEMCSG